MDSLDVLAGHLAHNLMALRMARGLTQGELAKLAGLPRSTLTNLESGSGNPSLMNLARLSSSLQVSIEELLAPPRADCQLISAQELRRREYDSGKVAVVALLPDPIPGLEIDRLEIQPGGWKQGIPHLAGTKEYLTCVKGEITVYVSGENFRLMEGDVLAFPGDRVHSYRNEGREFSLSYSVVSLTPRRSRR